MAAGMLIALASCQSVGGVDSVGNGRATQDTSGLGLRDTVTLAPGETAEWRGSEIGFQGVEEDSRCPTDVTCVWEGNARVAASVGPGAGQAGPTHQLILNTAVEPKSGEARGVRVTLLEVRPEPVSTGQIPPEDYRVTLALSVVAP
jgi:hypothetical protein